MTVAGLTTELEDEFVDLAADVFGETVDAGFALGGEEGFLFEGCEGACGPSDAEEGVAESVVVEEAVDVGAESSAAGGSKISGVLTSPELTLQFGT